MFLLVGRSLWAATGSYPGHRGARAICGHDKPRVRVKRNHGLHCGISSAMLPPQHANFDANIMSNLNYFYIQRWKTRPQSAFGASLQSTDCETNFLHPHKISIQDHKKMPHRKPTALLELRNSFANNPARKRDNEPIVTEPLGMPPDRLTEDQAMAWQEIANNCAPGVLMQADRHSLEMAAVLLAEFWANSVNMKGTHINLLERLLSKFGMTPSDRSKVTASGGAEKENPFARFKKS